MVTPLEQIPYFEGDHWPMALEKAVPEEEEIAKNRSSEDNAADKLTPTKKKRTPIRLTNRLHLTPSLDSSLKEIKDNYFVVWLHPSDSGDSLGVIIISQPCHILFYILFNDSEELTEV